MGDFYMTVAERAGLDVEDEGYIDVVSDAMRRTPPAGTTVADLVRAVIKTIKADLAAAV